MNAELENYFSQSRDQIDHCLNEHIERHTLQNSRLSEAMKYSALMGGKRIRPILVMAAAKAVGADQTLALEAASAIEFIHAYSLVHDDLPAMDDDDLRRGQPTCHIAYDESTAILAGDALQTLAFSVLANSSTLPSDTKVEMIQILSQASGARGMVLGQAIDLESVGKELSVTDLEYMHLHKTGAIIEASVLLGAKCSADVTDEELSALSRYAKAIGLAFQVQDDIIDVTSDTDILGKTQGSDISRNKPTYPKLLGLDGAIAKAKELYQESLNALEDLPRSDTRILKMISEYIVSRIS